MNSTNSSTVNNANVIWVYTWTKVLACFFGILTNLINTLVFANRKKLKNQNYVYMLSNSIVNLIYLIISLMGSFFTNCSVCDSSTTYFATLYSIGAIYYFTSCLAIFRILVEIVLSANTYCILTNSTWLSKLSPKLVLPILFVVALLVYAQQPFANQIFASSQGEKYAIRASDFGNSVLGKTIAIIQASFRILLIVIVLNFLNIANLYKFRKRFNAKKYSLDSKLVENTQKSGAKIITYL